MKPEVEALIVRGNITLAELKELRCNSEEWEAIIPALDDEAFAYKLQHCIDNLAPRAGTVSYADALANLYGPEAVRRLQERGTTRPKRPSDAIWEGDPPVKIDPDLFPFGRSK